jgi:hypothetical protein
MYLTVLMIFVVGSYAESLTHDSTGINNTAVIRAQLRSIADEVIDSAKFDVQEHVAVIVEGEGPRMLTENAFIETLQKRKYTSVATDTASVHQLLHVYILGTDIKLRELNAGTSERITRTALETRMTAGAERTVYLLGTFQRETKDTVQTPAPGFIPAVQNSDDNGILQRMLTPLIVVGGAVMIVYLFFTVRS